MIYLLRYGAPLYVCSFDFDLLFLSCFSPLLDFWCNTNFSVFAAIFYLVVFSFGGRKCQCFKRFQGKNRN